MLPDMRSGSPSIITLSSHVAYGAVGNRIIVPALEALGLSAIALSTVQLPWHPGLNAIFGKGARIVPEEQAFAAIIENLCSAPWLGNVNAMITGYLGSAAQATEIAKLVKALKRANPSAHYLCDPVIGDNGGLYVPVETATAIRDRLWPLADCVTPNQFEFGWITGQASLEHAKIIKTAKDLAKQHVIITSCNAGADQIGNLLVSSNQAKMISHPALSPTPNGTGDLLAALFLGNMVKGEEAEAALIKAASGVFAAIKDANHFEQSSLAPEHLRDGLGREISEMSIERVGGTEFSN